MRLSTGQPTPTSQLSHFGVKLCQLEAATEPSASWTRLSISGKSPLQRTSAQDLRQLTYLDTSTGEEWNLLPDVHPRLRGAKITNDIHDVNELVRLEG